MAVVIVSMVLILLIALGVGAIVLVGLSDRSRDDHTGLRGTAGRLAQTLNGDREIGRVSVRVPAGRH